MTFMRRSRCSSLDCAEFHCPERSEPHTCHCVPCAVLMAADLGRRGCRTVMACLRSKIPSAEYQRHRGSDHHTNCHQHQETQHCASTAAVLAPSQFHDNPKDAWETKHEKKHKGCRPDARSTSIRQISKRIHETLNATVASVLCPWPLRLPDRIVLLHWCQRARGPSARTK